MAPSGSAAEAVDRARLARMGAEVGEAALRHFVELFRELLGGRLARIAQAAAGRTEDGLRAALDLGISSEMLGARRLAAAAADAAVLLRNGEPIGPGRMAALRAEAERVEAALRQILGAV